MHSSSRMLGIAACCALAAACSGGGSGGSGGSSSGSSSGGVSFGNTPVLDYLLPYASADSSGNITQLSLVDPNGGFKSAPQVLTLSSQTTLAKLNYLGSFNASASMVEHTRPNLYYYVSGGALFGVNLRTTLGAARSSQLGNMSNLTPAAVCSINSLGDNVATNHLRIYYSLAGPTANCAGSDLSSFYVGSDATAATAPTTIGASGEILDITLYRNPATGVAAAALIREANGELLYTDGNFQNAKTIQAAGALAPTILDNNSFRVVLAGPIPGGATIGIYSVEADGSVNTLLTAPAGTTTFSSVAAPNHTLYAAFGPPLSGGTALQAGSASRIYGIDETRATAPTLLYSSSNPIGAFRAFSTGLVTLEGVPETANPTLIDQVLNYEAFQGGTTGVPVQIVNEGASAVVSLADVSGSLLLYNVRQTTLPAGTPGQLGSTAKIASVATAQVVSTQALGTSWFGLGEIVNRDLTSNSLGGALYVAQAYNLQQRDSTDAGKDSFFVFPAANLAQGNYAGIAQGSVDYGTSVIGVTARGQTAREDTGLGELAVTYAKGAAAVNDVYAYDDFNNLGAQLTNTPAVSEATY